MSFSWVFFWQTVVPKLLAAVPITLELTLWSALGSLILGSWIAFGLKARRRSLRGISQCYSVLIRGTPLLVQLYMIYYGLGSLVPGAWMRHSWASPLLRDAFWYGLVALIINEAAYVAVILRSGLDAIPKGEIEAATALGFSRWTIVRKFEIPRAFMIMLPTFTSELILLLKSTALVSTITVFDVVGTANVIRFNTFRVVEPLIGAAIVYIIIVAVISFVSMLLERYLSRMR